MRTSLALLLLLVLALPACATRSAPCDVLKANEGQTSTGARASQDVGKADVLTGAAIADSDGGANLSNQKVGVDVQSPNQATGAAFNIAPLTGGGGSDAAARILATTSPGEAATIRRLAEAEARVERLHERLDGNVVLTPEERARVEADLKATEANVDDLVRRLDSYSERKLAAAQAFVPSLPELRTVVYLITSHQTAGNDTPNITDAQAESIARTAEKALAPAPVPSPAVK